MAILDFAKAFDKVPHDLLLQKLTHYGISGNIHNWIKSWLMNRSQVVQVDGAQSDPVRVTSGVPQGSVLGPLMFLIFINDIHCEISSQLRLFADDTLIYRVIDSDQDYHTLQSDLNKLSEWAQTWGMEFNVDKCYVMHLMSRYRKRSVVCIPYNMLGKDLSRVSSNPYLGVLFHEDMTWSPHIQATVAKAKGTLAFLSRNLYGWPEVVKRRAYITYVRPIAEYASSIWDPFTQTDTALLESIQRQAARFVCNKPYRRYAESHDSVSAMLNHLGWPTLQERRQSSRIKFMEKIINKSVAIPEAYLPGVSYSGLTRATKRDASKGELPYLSTNQGHTLRYNSSFMPRTVRDWNLLPKGTGFSFKGGSVAAHH